MINRKLKILIRGYYGFGNLGDDVLLITVFQLIKTHISNAEITILSNAPEPSYIYTILEENIRIIDDTHDEHFDFIVDGGGGVYFDFKNSGWKYHIINGIIKIIGYSLYSNVITSVKKIIGKTEITSNYQLGIGIGVGTFTSDSAKFATSIRKLGNYQKLLVRDLESFENLKKLNINTDIQVFSDLAFLSTYWLPVLNQKQIGMQSKIGIVARSWPEDEGIQNWLQEKSSMLQANGFKIVFFLFESMSDQAVLKRVSTKFQTLVWDPVHTNLATYLTLFNEMDIIVSMRAHGAIIGACLEKPTICLEVEPKLKIVADMLKRSSTILKMNEDDEQVLNCVKMMLAKQAQAKLDKSRNTALMKKAEEEFLDYFLKIH